MHGRRLFPALLSLMLSPVLLPAQTAGTPGRIVGTVTATANASVTVHPASGPDMVVALDAQTRMLEVEPGAKTLANAKPITAADVATGDRVLVSLTAVGDAAHPVAARLIAIKQADLAQAHAQQSADWRTNGVAGIAASVDAATGTVTLKARMGAQPVVLHTNGSTVFRQYAPDSTAFADTRPSTLAAIVPGDQVRARGARDAGGTSVDAAEVVSGSFADIAGTVVSADAGANTITLKNLATKKTMTLAVAPDTQLRRLPDGEAERLAKAASRHAGRGAGGEVASAGEAGSGGPGAGPVGGEHSESEVLERAPAIPLSALKKGDAVMVVASGPGAPKATAITIVAGVEPLLEAPAEASEGLFSASWNLGGGGGDESGPQR